MDDTARHLPVTRPLLPRGQLIALDGLATVGLLAAVPSFTTTTAQPAVAGVTVPGWVEAVLVVGAAVPVAARRLWPRAVFGVVLAMTIVGMLLGVARDPFFAASFALYTVALTGSASSRVPPLAVGACSIGLLTLLAGSGVAMPRQPLANVGWIDDFGVALLGLALMGGTWTVGRAVADRRMSAARAAAQLAERAVAEERLRIARELHDVVAHSMSLIAVKAGIANHVAATRPGEAHDALRVIETTSRGALTEMRHLLGVLRAEVDPDTALADRAPAPGPAELPALADRAAMAGVRVDMDVRGLDGLPDGVGLSVYRIVQEALTNVVKHAAPARCRVTATADGQKVVLEVTDDGPGVRVLPDHEGGAGGHGLIGMRERVAVYGGTFAAGPRPEGGFRVSARLPYTSPPAGRRQPTGTPPPCGNPEPARLDRAGVARSAVEPAGSDGGGR